MRRAVALDLEDARILLEVLRNEKITGEYDLKQLGEIYRVKGILEDIISREDMRQIIYEARREMV